jgi:ribosomal protein S18 acetylase RimI-like enzyme
MRMPLTVSSTTRDPNPVSDVGRDRSSTSERLRTTGGLEVILSPVAPADHAELHAAFARLVAADEGYPQPPDEPVSIAEFHEYWLVPAAAAFVARQTSDGALVGAYTMKPNGFGRAAHVANAGYFVTSTHRDRGLGAALVEHSFGVARDLGFDALQFNFVFESNPARRLYERLGFEVVGRVPEVIEGEAVYIYWRQL